MKRTYLLWMTSILLLGLLAGCASPADSVPTPAPVSAYVDGVYEAVSDAGPRGYAWARIVIVGDDIVFVDSTEFDGTGLEKDPDFYGGDRFPHYVEAHQTLAQQIAAANSWDVEGVTGATATTTLVQQAARRALEKALVEPTATTTYFDGTFMGLSDKSNRGWGVAWVTVENDTITEIQLEETVPRQDEDGEYVFDPLLRVTWTFKDEDYHYEPFGEAREAIAEAMVSSQRADVDAYTGATGSSARWVQAVERALDLARR